jgi:hypothetical protein
MVAEFILGHRRSCSRGPQCALAIQNPTVRVHNPIRAYRTVRLRQSLLSRTKRFGAGRHERANISSNTGTRSKATIRCPFGRMGGNTSRALSLMRSRHTRTSPLRGGSRDKFQRSTGTFTGCKGTARPFTPYQWPPLARGATIGVGYGCNAALSGTGPTPSIHL